MAIDVTTDIAIHRPVDEVAAFAANPDNAPAWTASVKSVRWETPPPLGVGSRVTFFAEFLGRSLQYTYEIVAHTPGRQLVMRAAEGPISMETSFGWEPAAGGGTRMTLRNLAEPFGVPRLLEPLIGAALGRMNRKDLERLKQRLERGTA